MDTPTLDGTIHEPENDPLGATPDPSSGDTPPAPRQPGTVPSWSAGRPRKAWAELSVRHKEKLLARQQTPEGHDAGRPVPLPDPEKRDRAPRRRPRRATTTTTAKPQRSGPSNVELRAGIERMLGLVGLAMQWVDDYDGEVILTRAEAVATDVVELADRRPEVRRFLERATTGSDYTKLGMTALSIIVPILINHGLLPRMINTQTTFGVPMPPEPARSEPAPQRGATADPMTGAIGVRDTI